MLTAIQIGEYPGWIICYEISVFAPDCSDITGSRISNCSRISVNPVPTSMFFMSQSQSDMAGS